MKAAQSQSPMDGVAWTSGHLSGDREEMGDGPNIPTRSREGGSRMADMGIPTSLTEYGLRIRNALIERKEYFILSI